MAENSVQYTKTGHLGRITLKQTGDLEIASELTEICAAINGDEDIRAVLINATGDFFATARYYPCRLLIVGISALAHPRPLPPLTGQLLLL